MFLVFPFNNVSSLIFHVMQNAIIFNGSMIFHSLTESSICKPSASTACNISSDEIIVW